MVDQTMGKWKMNHSLSENTEAFGAVMQFPKEVVENLAGKIEIVNEASRDGDTFTMSTNFGGVVETVVFKLNEKFTSNSMGVEAENLFTMEGDVMCGTHTVKGVTSNSKRYLKDGKLCGVNGQGRNHEDGLG